MSAFIWLTGAETFGLLTPAAGILIPGGYLELSLNFAMQPCTAQTVEAQGFEIRILAASTMTVCF